MNMQTNQRELPGSSFACSTKELSNKMKNTTGRIKLDSTVQDTIVAMAEGNMGALTVIMQLMKLDAGISELLHLDDRAIYGSDIWITWKDICNMDMTTFLSTIRDHNNGLEDKLRIAHTPV